MADARGRFVCHLPIRVDPRLILFVLRKMFGSQLQQALDAIDAANAEDPNRERLADGSEVAKELLYSQRMSAWLTRFEPQASDALVIAARGQHICRWTSPRTNYPMDKAGYHRWRSDLQKFHAAKLGEILMAVGYDATTISRVQSLVRKERLKLDSEAQTLEDVICLVFLESYFADFSQEHDEAKLITILRKTWAKMSPRGQQTALELTLPNDLRQLVERAVA